MLLTGVNRNLCNGLLNLQSLPRRNLYKALETRAALSSCRLASLLRSSWLAC